MFEAERTAQEPNGLFLSPHTINALFGTLATNPDGSLADIEIGTQVLTTDEVANVVQAIKLVPPAPFNLA